MVSDPCSISWLGRCISAEDMAEKTNGTIIVMDLRKHGTFVGERRYSVSKELNM